MDLPHTLLYVGHPGQRTAAQRQALQQDYHLRTAHTGRSALSLSDCQPALIVLDADSMRTPGGRICRQLHEAHVGVPLIHVVPPDYSSDDSPATVVLRAPVSSQHLLSTAQGLLNQQPQELLVCGPYSMDVPNRLLIAHGQAVQLTPKVALLLAAFLRQPNQTLDRKTLMAQVWHTDYLGDTRTLDVHIRWVRQALEHKGRYPRTLKTVRGIGYRLEVSINGHNGPKPKKADLVRSV